ncbi:MAG: diguanylate cyclase [Acidovorax sp.]|nr:diguanylate cyclase [Acidovorax sp.]
MSPMKTNILIVDDNASMIQLVARMLKGVARLRFATGGAEALELMRQERPDLVLLDAEMPGMSGYEVCEAIRADALLSTVPVVFLTGNGDTAAEVRGLEAGAVDFITKPVHEALLLARVRTQLRVKTLSDELRLMACTDGLTGVANRRHFDEMLNLEWVRNAREGTSLALLMVDVDHFKRYNDCHGHPAGDVCLKAVARALASVARRPADLVGRVGGEEFAVLLPGTDLKGARRVAQEAIEAVHALAVPHADSPTAPQVTASIGVAACSDAEFVDRASSSLVRVADEALYAAKSAGRNRWCTVEKG